MRWFWSKFNFCEYFRPDVGHIFVPSQILAKHCFSIQNIGFSTWSCCKIVQYFGSTKILRWTLTNIYYCVLSCAHPKFVSLLFMSASGRRLLMILHNNKIFVLHLFTLRLQKTVSWLHSNENIERAKFPGQICFSPLFNNILVCLNIHPEKSKVMWSLVSYDFITNRN